MKRRRAAISASMLRIAMDFYRISTSRSIYLTPSSIGVGTREGGRAGGQFPTHFSKWVGHPVGLAYAVFGQAFC